MEFIYPDLSWYIGISKQNNVPPRCPYANVYRCPRYYSSLYLLGDAGITTKIKPDKIKALDKLWKKSDILPVIAEHDTAIMGFENGKSGFSNFCPEVTFDVFGLFAVSLHRYADEIDRDTFHVQLRKKAYPKDWRWNWAYVEPIHYLECAIYLQLISQPTPNLTLDKNPQEILEIKPGFMGISLNIRVLLTHLCKWWLSKHKQ